MKVYAWLNAEGRTVTASIPDNYRMPGESEVDYLTRRAPMVVPVEDYEILDLEEATARVLAEDAAHAPVVFARLKPINFELGMLSLNVTADQIDAAINGLPEPDRTIARIYWTRATGFLRDDPLIEQIAAIFNITSEQIDEAWRYAESLG
jgi:hypothetical protein